MLYILDASDRANRITVRYARPHPPKGAKTRGRSYVCAASDARRGPSVRRALTRSLTDRTSGASSLKVAGTNPRNSKYAARSGDQPCA
jgi:hypothetical protein